MNDLYCVEGIVATSYMKKGLYKSNSTYLILGVWPVIIICREDVSIENQKVYRSDQANEEGIVIPLE